MSKQLGNGDDSTPGDLARDSLARNAQITLVSVLLGAIVAALFIGLPANYATHVWSLHTLPLDLRVLATFLATVDLWIEYSWSVIAHRWPFTLTHNLAYFAIAGAMIGWASSVSSLAAWLAWLVALCLAVAVQAIVDILSPIGRTLHKVRPAKANRKEVAGKDVQRRLQDLLNQTRLQIAVYLIAAPVFLYGSLEASDSLPTWAPMWAHLQVSPILWGALGLAIVLVDMVIEGHSMAGERYKQPLKL